MSRNSVAAIILAAGASRRMGKPKQLLPYREHTLLGHVIQCTLASSCSSVIIILGANAGIIKSQIEHFPVEIVKNPEWNQGISSSIRCGIQYIKEQSLNVDGIIFLVCDQPSISTETITQLLDLYNEASKPIIASQYAGIIGIPVLFDYGFCSELLQLKGDRGAKRLIQKYRDQVATIEFPRGEIDLDTFTEYQQFRRLK